MFCILVYIFSCFYLIALLGKDGCFCFLEEWSRLNLFCSELTEQCSKLCNYSPKTHFFFPREFNCYILLPNGERSSEHFTIKKKILLCSIATEKCWFMKKCLDKCVIPSRSREGPAVSIDIPFLLLQIRHLDFPFMCILFSFGK